MRERSAGGLLGDRLGVVLDFFCKSELRRGSLGICFCPKVFLFIWV